MESAAATALAAVSPSTITKIGARPSLAATEWMNFEKICVSSTTQ
jgi:hypothetical protein